jgi:hypothetical protein
MITAASGTSRQTWTAMTDAIASPGRPNQYVFVWMRSSRRSTQSIGENTESSSHSHVIVDNATGVVQGRSTRKRTIHRPRNSATRTLASTLPKTTMSSIEIAVNTNVLRRDRQNTGSAKIRSKLRRPTQSKPGSPPVTSERLNAMASPKGTPTSATM